MEEATQLQTSASLVGRKVMLGLPTYDFKLSAKMAISLMDFVVKAGNHGVQVIVGNISGCSVVSRARNLIVNDFLESDCTDLMFIDADINFNADDIFRLMVWNQNPKYGIVAGVPVARKKGQVYISTLDTEGDGKIFMNAYGLVKAKRVATAFMLINREVFEKLGPLHPEWTYIDDRNMEGEIQSFFDFKSTPDGYVGEDYLFCDRVHEIGMEVWIDPTIKLGHMGIHEFEGSFGEDWLYPHIKEAQQDS